MSDDLDIRRGYHIPECNILDKSRNKSPFYKNEIKEKYISNTQSIYRNNSLGSSAENLLTQNRHETNKQRNSEKKDFQDSYKNSSEIISSNHYKDNLNISLKRPYHEADDNDGYKWSCNSKVHRTGLTKHSPYNNNNEKELFSCIPNSSPDELNSKTYNAPVNRNNENRELSFTLDSNYMPGVDLILGDNESFIKLDEISHFTRTPCSSPKMHDSTDGKISNKHEHSSLANTQTVVREQKNASSTATSPLSVPSTGMELSKAAKERYAHLRQQCKRIQQKDRQPLPPLHLHLSNDGTSPLPPGWQRAPNTKMLNEEIGSKSSMYAYYYYHTRTRQTRWDPPVYPWDADPTDTILGETGVDDPEAPYNWGCASRYAVTHEEVEAMYARIRQRMLERQCQEMLHEMVGRPDCPNGLAEQNFAIDLFTLVHNTLRTFRDARCKLGRIINDEDLYYLTKKLAQAAIIKEVLKFRQTQATTANCIFSNSLHPEISPSVHSRVTTYVRKYMESKGAYYRRRVQQQFPTFPNQPGNGNQVTSCPCPPNRTNPTMNR